MSDETTTALRIVDANLNRLREALRVIEEYHRFGGGGDEAVALKAMRHSLQSIEERIGRQRMLAGRDTATDPFSSEVRPEEEQRRGLADVATASLKRAQEAARVLEEYTKVLADPAAAQQAKKVRFGLYDLEKRLAQ